MSARERRPHKGTLTWGASVVVTPASAEWLLAGASSVVEAVEVGKAHAEGSVTAAIAKPK